MNTKHNLIKILSSAGFNLRKFASNSSELITEQNINIQIRDKVFKTLGVQWDPHIDSFSYTIPQFNVKQNLTKRVILAFTSQIFDPLDFLSPVIMVAKIIIQRLGQLSLQWDDVVDKEIQDKWIQFTDSLPLINSHHIPQQVLISNYIYVH